MAKKIKNKALKPLSRSVSIIGVGATPYMYTMDNPDTEGLSDLEMFGAAAIEAMKDAGITAKDVEFYYSTCAMPALQGGYITPNAQYSSWFGMKGKASAHHSEACCSGYIALEQAVMAVASGTYDIVLSGGCDMSWSLATPRKPSYMRRQFDNDLYISEGLDKLYSKDYAAPSLGANPLVCDSWLDSYVKENKLTADKIDDVLCQLSIDCRRAAALNPRALNDKTYAEEAAEVGMTDQEYIRSQYNPKFTRYLRVSNFELRCDGAAALIVCPTEMAYKYTDHPIEVLGTGHATLNGMIGNLEKYATSGAYEQIKELTGLTGADMDIFYANDFFNSSQLLAAEECEYLPKGEGWKYMLESRTAFDGDRPINTNGGRCQYGHAHGTSGLHDIFEAVKQLRGEMGRTQVKVDPQYAMLRGFGGGQNVTVQILNKL
ncbi:thiolase domain-containing protein [Faecalicatena orotica]|uniref:Acetyl-CoA C-acetyltransferase n=1 Tax=Faecalicatena orotica TaxID=1544 RepID=A0A2Y9B9I9_9FIRM|nr:thiolase family protein [Faecalicatena orotica]PWJ32347.1 acetyl-CoA C-acetyltransferase [Faecalicatena orotica]SSA54181.1 acetyl-CoA C-acetyltransferase [Faecalicatena orotica]